MARPRILGGSAKGMPLDTPPRGTRPSPSRLREALFDALQFRERGPFLDLYAGSGALGLEAASRGWDATLVELSPAAAAVIRRNARRLRLDATVVQDDALAYAARSPGRFSVVAAAPPYPDDLVAIFRDLLRGGPAAPGGVYLLQHPTQLDLTTALADELRAVTADKDAAGRPTGSGAGVVTGVRVRRYGSNAVAWVRAGGPGSVPDGVSGTEC
ncbi:MAG: RsmD family RNA methyltransferase [Trueperaceae bacterium]